MPFVLPLKLSHATAENCQNGSFAYLPKVAFCDLRQLQIPPTGIWSPKTSVNICRLCSLLSLDMDAYAAKYGNKSVRKNLTVPAWLNTFAETERLNVSKVLQQALTTLYEKKAAMV